MTKYEKISRSIESCDTIIRLEACVKMICLVREQYSMFELQDLFEKYRVKRRNILMSKNKKK